MTPRLALAAVFIISLIGGVAAKEGKKSQKNTSARTWKDIFDHSWKTGTDWPIKAPSAKNLGYSSDVMKARGVSIDQKSSADNREHSIVIVYDLDNTGTAKPVDMVLGTMRVTEVKDGKLIDGYRLRLDLDGKPIKAMHSSGLVGHVVQEVLSANSKEAQQVYKAEKELYLNNIDLKKLTP